MLNQMDITAEFKRIELCDLMLACRAAWSMSGDTLEERSDKWLKLHDKIEEMVNEFDKTQGW